MSSTPEFSLIVFDWDGTLTDSSAGIVATLQAAASAVGLPPGDALAIRATIGSGMLAAVNQVYPNIHAGAAQQLIAKFRQMSARVDAPVPDAFPRVAATLTALQDAGAMLAVATGKSRVGLDRDLRDLGLAKHFVATRTADETRAKPNPQMLEQLLRVTGVMPADALMVGDTTFDLEMATHAGMRAVGATYGVHSRAALQAQQPWAFIDAIDELVALLGASTA